MTPDRPRPSLVDRFRRARRDPTLAVLEGVHALKHALRFGADVSEAVCVDRAALRALAGRVAPDVAGRIAALASPVPADVFDRLAPRSPTSGVIALARRPEISLERLLAGPGPAPIVLLERPRHLGNLGAVVRVSAAADAAGVLTTGEHDPWHPAALRGSAGLHYAVPVAWLDEGARREDDDAPPSDAGEGRAGLDPRPGDSAADAAADGVGPDAAGSPGAPASGVDRIRRMAPDRPLVVLDPGGEPLRPGILPERAVIAFGSERRGLSDALRRAADRRIGLPMRPGVSSLNLATAVAATLYTGLVCR